MDQLHKRFNVDQIKVLMRGNLQGTISRGGAEEVLQVNKTRFFALLKDYRHDPETFSIDYARPTPARLLFPILEAHSDNGDEFFNQFLLRFWGKQSVEPSRSRFYHKNDNRFVEENNHSLVRAYLGPSCLDTVEHTCLLNQLYEHLCFYHNFFQPQLHLQEKRPTANHLRRIYDQPQPPLSRLCSSGIRTPAVQSQLIQLRTQTSPLLWLRAKIKRDGRGSRSCD